MKLIKNIALTLAALTLAACTQGEPEIPANGGGNNNNDELVEIRPTMTIAGMAEAVNTRAVADEMAEMKFSFAFYGNSTGSKLTDATRTGGTGAQPLTFNSTQYYPADGSNVKCKGYSPEATVAVGYYFWSLYGDLDLIEGQATGSKTTLITNIQFNHLLAQLQFYPYAETQGIADQWGQITKIEVLNQYSHVKWMCLDENAAPGIDATSGTMPFTVSGISTSGVNMKITRAAAVQMGNPCMVWPQTDASYNLQLRITTRTTAGVEKATTVTRTGTLLANTPYRFYLRFTGQSIEVDVQTLSIENWVPGADQSGTLSKTYPYVVDGKRIVFQDADGATELTNRHTKWNQTPENTTGHAIAYYVPTIMEVKQSDDPPTAWNNTNGPCTAPWRRPNTKELQYICQNKDLLTGVDPFTSKYYWTSTEDNTVPPRLIAVAIDFTSDEKTPTYLNKTDTTPAVRCVKDIE